MALYLGGVKGRGCSVAVRLCDRCMFLDVLMVRPILFEEQSVHGSKCFGVGNTSANKRRYATDLLVYGHGRLSSLPNPPFFPGDPASAHGSHVATSRYTRKKSVCEVSLGMTRAVGSLQEMVPGVYRSWHTLNDREKAERVYGEKQRVPLSGDVSYVDFMFTTDRRKVARRVVCVDVSAALLEASIRIHVHWLGADDGTCPARIFIGAFHGQQVRTVAGPSCHHVAGVLLAALTRKLELGFTDAEAAIDDVLESTEPLDALLPTTRLEMIRKMTKKVYEPEDRIQEANDVACPLYVVLSGTVELLSPVIARHASHVWHSGDA